jgi:flagellar biosynthesis/type III secretory pathway M-ring protein FliF/YscJ
MFYFLAQTTESALTSDQVGIWTALMEGAAKWGLGIALSILMFAVFFFLIRKVMANFDTARVQSIDQADKERVAHAEDSKQERDTFLRLLDQKDLTINNHINHLTTATLELRDSQIKLNDVFLRCQDICNKSNKEQCDKIVDAIKNQTDLFIRLFGDKPK